MDSDAFLRLWESNRTRISTRLYRLGVGDEAEDLLQDVFLRVYRLVVTKGLDLDERYLMRAASSRAIDYGRTVAKKRGRAVP